MQNKFYFYRNDQRQEFFEFDPADPACLDEAGFRYFGRVLHALAPEISDKGLVFYVTAWTVKELPSYGSNVVACILQDEWGREAPYRHKVGLVLKSCGLSPFIGNVYKVGGLQDKITNFLGQIRAFMRDGSGRLQILARRLIRQKIAPKYNMPLGYYAHEDIDFVDIKDRQHDLYFAGSVNHMASKKLIKRPKELARARMAAALQQLSARHSDLAINTKITGTFLESVGTDNQNYLQNMMQTRICPIPRGANLETFRFYEAIRYGCIPVCEVVPEAYFYDDSPVIKLDDWGDLENVVVPLLKDERALTALHKEVLEWWHNKCAEDVTAGFIAQKIQDAGL